MNSSRFQLVKNHLNPEVTFQKMMFHPNPHIVTTKIIPRESVIYCSCNVGILNPQFPDHETIDVQARDALYQLAHSFKASGTSMNKVIKLQVYLIDIRDQDLILKEIANFFPNPQHPNRIIYIVKELPGSARVAMDAIAKR